MIKNKQILSLSQSLKNVVNLSGIRFCYGIARNSVIIDREIEVFQTTTKASKEFQEYDTKRIELAKEMAKKDEKGNPVIKDNAYVPENQKAFDKKIEELKGEYKEAVEAREKQIDDFNEFLEKESGVKLYMINFEDVPKEINAGQLMGLMPIIQDTDKVEKVKTKLEKKETK